MSTTPTTLDPWQNPETGFPSDAYFDAVIVELEKAGIGVHDCFRNEDWEFAIELDRAAYADGPFEWAKEALFVCWHVSEESDPLGESDDDEIRGEFVGSGQCAPGWQFVPHSKAGGGDYVQELDHPRYPGSPMHPLEEPDVVAQAVVNLVRGAVSGDRPERTEH